MHHLNEQTRCAYLEAMGITQWYARHPVANGQDIDWPEAESRATDAPSRRVRGLNSGADILARAGVEKGVEASTEQNSVPAAMATSPTAVPEVEAKETPTTDVTPEPSGAGADPASPSTSRQANGVEFVQRWWARGPWCIVDTRAKNMPQAQQKAADRLMAALAQVLCGERTPEVAHHIDWPLFVNRSIPHDVQEARFYLSQKWEAVQQQAPTERLILLGELTPELLGHAPRDMSARSTWTTEAGICCLHGPGSSELMHLPGRKREFWKQLQHWLSESRP